MNRSNHGPDGNIPEGFQLRFLSLAQVRKIDDLLTQLGEYGEVHLVIQHGELRYINKVESYRAWKADEDS